ncbi:DUF6415 family natural product biosynthesis protein [Streptomyces thermoviolaceus]|uniref:DUF6415 family natural product biosynthesis protein n=1 Tax=Streptomyces thermoviolaceus TaxID=1952 RepID=UPI00203BC9ED|nr:DUF6415 family natural product biosynthesis protein [Streptomyces thermoviolaceus]MCM3264780.1 DUF6415 family natural product biosynthesis protein [Streptomyces thermoviolaceus]
MSTTQFAHATPEMLARVLNRLQEGTLDGEALLDDCAMALDEVAPDEATARDLIERLRRHGRQLVNISVSSGAGADAWVAATVGRFKELEALDVPGERLRVVGHARRLASLVTTLLERLCQLDQLREFA